MHKNILHKHLGESFKNLPPLLQQAHSGDIHLHGSVVVKRGNLLANLIANIIKMPPANSNCNLDVYGSHNEDVMKWQRHFENHVMESTFRLQGDYLTESLGPINLLLKLSIINNKLIYNVEQSSIFGITIPKPFQPKLTAFEMEYNGLYRFHVSINLPIIGLLIGYNGDLHIT
ncbi:DUF4166 domain-containing protein [Endozoicomonas sp. SM1973]|uniref:DUF4166 domain-containing protein n=1 Tax=Spartinivicinus marinus TaxID=2994442 RepID=A0A853I186_9GAMM|nr:DUF4166 domain-containing protein [Spartinivicinus marinus]MCX4027449.1 DUF4166 domain-containing protein [Spartinivicinus marinus]NYZ66379.1 DUF4166 domain-containing protein [Spartinivicinus marinus]